ncbi:MAG: hypothetical protein BroJett021_28140 [Chloroflexota bacterium]|nr:MAG: hypothetical protein BroJett021_28140 [Chloroflexota bacterium]
MIQGFDRLDAGLSDLLGAMLLVVIAVLAWMVREARRECAALRQRAEVAELWCLLAEEEEATVRRRLADVERRHENLQQMYAQLTRRLLAKNFYEIEQHVRRKRAAE